MIFRFLRSLWRGMDVFRRVVHLVLMLAVFAVIVMTFSAAAPPLPARAALLIAPEGPVVEQLDGDPLSRTLDELANGANRQTLLRDVVDGLKAAAEDNRIRAVALMLNGMDGASLAQLQRIGEQMDTFRASGKRIVAYADYYDQSRYFLAAHADEAYLHPSGALFIEGFGRYRTYMREAIDKLDIDWNVFRVGEYKSFVEPYTRNDMSPEDRSSSRQWLNELWQIYQRDVQQARGLEAGDIEAYAATYLERLAANQGDLAALALESGLIDELRTRDQVRERLITLAGADKNGQSFARVQLSDYARAHRATEMLAGGNKTVGVVVASGDILDGEQPPGTIGGDTLARVLQRARHDESIAAVVLRIDSGGGSKFASEVIAREIELLREAGKPVVASMSSVAASGGYWLAMKADEVWARPSTITGSIGIGSYFPTFQRTMENLGLNVDGVGTTRWSGDFRLDRSLDEDSRALLQMSIEHGYRQFVGAVAESRNMSYAQVERIAGGRVYTGATAKELGLVDVLGDLEGAIEAAAQRAGVPDSYRVRYIEKELTYSEMLALRLATGIRTVVGDRLASPSYGATARRLLGGFQREFERLARFNDPGHLYYHCLCGI